MGAEPDSQAGPEDEEMALEKNAGLIMGTNNSSIVSKRSVEKLYLPQPHFYRYFVRKPQRRSPTINRGYWLRMKAVEWVVRQFLEKPSDVPKVVLNLGCGYDPLPFQWLSIHPELCQNTKFVDVDFDELMTSKCNVIRATPKMYDLLTEMESASKDRDVLLDTLEYASIGCDLRNLKKLSRLLDLVVDLKDCLLLCVAEVSITYMHTDAADALIAWSSSIAPDVTFCLLEQKSPDREDHPFTATMLKHFNKLGTPLRSVLKYPGSHTQTARFFTSGFVTIECNSLWDLWGDPRFMSPSARLALDDVEPFDEWEDFALFASHYILVIAQTNMDPLFPRLTSRRDSGASGDSEVSARTASPLRPEMPKYFAISHFRNPEGEGRAHHGSAYPPLAGSRDVLAMHGGIGQKTRIGTASFYACQGADLTNLVLPPPEILARSCHTITALENNDNLLVGGRASPSNPMRDCWLQRGTKWHRVHDLPFPLYRHRAAPVSLPGDQFGVILFGGKTGPSKVVDVPALLWSPRNGWQILRSIKQDPKPRFGCSFIRLGFNHGLMFGGMRQDGVICQGFWRWRLMIRSGIILGIRFIQSSALDTTVGIYPWLSRLGASYSVIRNEVLVIGGVARQGCIPKEYEILSLLGSFSAFSEHEKEMDLRVSSVEPLAPPGTPRPLLIGHATHRVHKEMTLIMGGGAVCFSFGAYWNDGPFLIHDIEVDLGASSWSLTKPQAPPVQDSVGFQAKNVDPLERPSVLEVVEHVRLQDSDTFREMVRTGHPKILSGLDIGPCSSLWTPTYLRTKVAADRTIVIHSASSRSMNFQRKDFNYTTCNLEEFLDSITVGSAVSSNSKGITQHSYLRSLSNTSPNSIPANLASDWPEISSDFHLPDQLKTIAHDGEMPLHSSPLRITGDVNMWLHYDVMANVYFQIYGCKKLVLFPPHDLKHLSFPPGSTTSTIDIFSAPFSGTSDDFISFQESLLTPPPNTTPHAALLCPGDVLFIPPLWAHAVTPLAPLSPNNNSSTRSSSTTSVASPAMPPVSNPVSIAVNIFFYSLTANLYAAGRDVYGNRDLAVYEDGRRDIERLLKRFTHDDIPRDLASAYLDRLVQELKVKIENAYPDQQAPSVSRSGITRVGDPPTERRVSSYANQWENENTG